MPSLSVRRVPRDVPQVWNVVSARSPIIHTQKGPAFVGPANSPSHSHPAAIPDAGESRPNSKAAARILNRDRAAPVNREPRKPSAFQNALPFCQILSEPSLEELSFFWNSKRRRVSASHYRCGVSGACVGRIRDDRIRGFIGKRPQPSERITALKRPIFLLTHDATCSGHTPQRA